MEITLKPIGDKFHTVSYNIACDIGGGVDLHLNVETRFDGNGNAIVKFVILDGDKRIEFEKFDSAAGRYNMLIMASCNNPSHTR